MDINTTLVEDLSHIQENIYQLESKHHKQCPRLLEVFGRICFLLESSISDRKIEEYSSDSGEKCHCYKTDKPMGADEIKMKILDDITDGIDISQNNIEAGYSVKYNASEIAQFYIVLGLLNSYSLDMYKLDMINLYNKQYKNVEGTEEYGYTVTYDDTEVFTIRYIENKSSLLEDTKPSLNFELDFHAGYNKFYDIVNNPEKTRNIIETDIKVGIKVCEDKLHSKIIDSKANEYKKKISAFNKILKILDSDEINLDKLQKIHIFGNSACYNSMYIVIYNGNKLFNVNNKRELTLKQSTLEHLIIHDLEIDFYDGFYKLCNSFSSIMLDDIINNKYDIKTDLENGMEQIKKNIEAYGMEEDDLETIKNIEKILQLLNSDVISISKLQQVNFAGPKYFGEFTNCNYNGDTGVSSYTVLYDGIKLFCIRDIEEVISDDLHNYFFEVELFDEFNNLYSSLNSLETKKSE